MRKYTINEDFFQKIDSEEKAYWLGFIGADGHWDTNGTLQVNLKGSDIEHLKKLAKSLEFDGPVYNYLNLFNGQKFDRARIAICSKKLTDRLKFMAVVGFANFVPTELRCHFWRGTVDGDGHLDSYSKPRIRLVGDLEIVNYFRIFVNSLTTTRALVRPHYSIWQFEVVSNKARRVIDEIYGRATIALDRKLSVAQDILGQPKAQAVNSPWH